MDRERVRDIENKRDKRYIDRVRVYRVYGMVQAEKGGNNPTGTSQGGKGGNTP